MNNSDPFDLVVESIVKLKNGGSGNTILLPWNEEPLSASPHIMAGILKKLVNEASIGVYVPDQWKDKSIMVYLCDVVKEEKKNGESVKNRNPIKIAIYPGFDNWLASYLYSKNKKFSELLPTTLKKVGATILDLYEKFELHSSPRLIIPWYFNSETAHPMVRKESLVFLENRGIVRNYEIDQIKPASPLLELDLG